MKKLYILVASLTFSLFANAQNPSIGDDNVPVTSQTIIRENINNLRLPVDTLDTEDKYTKIVIFDNFTWTYHDIGHPTIDSTCLFDPYWTNEQLHAYKSYSKELIPDEVDLLLADENNHYCAPITGKVRSGYAFRRTREHQGIDVPLSTGDTIKAAFDGVVRYVGVTKQTGGYGNLVIIRHSNGLETYYGHLSKHLCSVNEVVKAGDVIGLGGSTGRSTGPHLHFEARYKGQTFDPSRLIDFETGNLRDSLLTLKKHYYSIYSHYGQSDEESIAASSRIVYSIKSGDTLGRVAQKYGTTVTAICRLNSISSKKLLRIGERIIVR